MNASASSPDVAALVGWVRLALDVDDCYHLPAGIWSALVDGWTQEQGALTSGEGADRRTRHVHAARVVAPAAPGTSGTAGGSDAAPDRGHLVVVRATDARPWTHRDRTLLRLSAERLALMLAEHPATVPAPRADAADQAPGPLAGGAASAVDSLTQQLLGLLSHELRTPLTTLRAGLELLAEDAADDGPAGLDDLQRDLVVRMQRAVDRLHELADNASRLRPAEPAPEVGPGDWTHLAEVVDEALAAVDLRDRALAVRINTDLDDVWVEAPGEDVREVLDELLENAVKFSPDGGEIAVESWIDAADRVALAVRDRGIGVADDEVDLIGRPFFKTRRSRVAETQGLGLGVAAARRTAEAWGGSIEYVAGAAGPDDEPGDEGPDQDGTTAVLTLPCRRGRRPVIPAPQRR